MPDLGPDICYSCQELLALVAESDLELSHFSNARQEILSVRTDVVLATCQECNWIVFDKVGRIGLTEIGKSITKALASANAAAALRAQITSMVRVYNWTWTTALRY